jgi:hypothetical protein
VIITEWDTVNDCEMCGGDGVVWHGHGGNEIEMPCPECAMPDEWHSIKQEDGL